MANLTRRKATAALNAVKRAHARDIVPRDHSGHEWAPEPGDLALREHLKDEHGYDDAMLDRKVDRGKSLAEIHAEDHKPEALYPEPVLVMDWSDTGAPAICWEEGPSEWAFLTGGGETSEEDRVMFAEASAEFGGDLKAPAHPKVKWPKGVYAEPYYSFVMCLYPA